MATKYIVNNVTGQTINGQSVLPTYKVYTALLTQTGDDNPDSTYSGNLLIGRTYQIFDLGGAVGYDFTNVGAPNNNLNTSFVATGTTPTSWGTNVCLNYNSGAPVVTVLENTIGNIWFTYNSDGVYSVFSNSLFAANKTYTILQLWGDDNSTNRIGFVQRISDNEMNLINADYLGNPANKIGDPNPAAGYLTSIEIRVYN